MQSGLRPFAAAVNTRRLRARAPVGQQLQEVGDADLVITVEVWRSEWIGAPRREEFQEVGDPHHSVVIEIPGAERTLVGAEADAVVAQTPTDRAKAKTTLEVAPDVHSLTDFEGSVLFQNEAEERLCP